MARIVFLLLVFANLAVYVWAAGYLGGRDDGREPERLRNQLQPERLRVSFGDTPAPAALLALAGVCRRVGPLGGAEAESLDKSIVGQGGSVALSSVDELSYWVFIAAVDGKPADNDIATLRKTGFKEFFVVAEEGPNLNSISLGNYAKEEAAKEKIARLVRNGIKSAKMATRAKPTGQVMLTVHGAPAMLDKALAGLTAEPIECPKE
ncbi:MAG: SPOR domain-containing protein [Rhodocyclales bacterium]|nr:SPOR domain-containing protein [Rhodocyclales bacterium]